MSQTSPLLEQLLEQSTYKPDQAAICGLNQQDLSYRQLAELLQTQGKNLYNSGYGEHNRIAVILPQGPVLATVCLALMSHAICAPLNPAHTLQEFEYFLESMQIDAIVTSAVEESSVTDLALKKQINVIRVHQLNDFAGNFEWRFDNDQLHTIADTVLSSGVRLILHTSGSTSLPRVVPLTSENLLESCSNLIHSLNLQPGDRCLNMLPLFHVGALVDLLLSPLLSGGSVMITSDMKASTFFEACQHYRPDWYQAVPTMLQNILDYSIAQPQQIRPALRFIRSVSSSLPNRLYHQIEKSFNCPVIEIYGMTETSGVICSNPLPPASRKQGSVGCIAGSQQVQLRDNRGHPVKAGQTGHIWVKGRNVIQGYANLNSDGFYDNHWFNTGDDGYFDNDAYLYLTGRSKEMINRGGEKISPLEIDRIAEQHPEVRQAASFAIPHASLGEDIAIALVIKQTATFNSEAFQQWMLSRLAQYKIPRKIYLLENLPRTTGGKLQRHKLLSIIQSQAGSLSNSTVKEPLTTDIEKKLADIWSRVLQVKINYSSDNFFDLGGDSLKAATLALELESLCQHEMPMSFLYQYPGLKQQAKELHKITPEYQAKSITETGMLKSLAAFLTAWQGTRLTAKSLIVGRNISGNRQPLFWCTNSHSEFDALARELDPQQPIYGMRSLYKIDYKSSLNNQALAQVYIDEILQIQPRGPYLIGGFCEAAKISFHIAKLLRFRGENITSLMLQEQFLAEPYNDRVAMLICSGGEKSPVYRYVDAPSGWRKYYSNQLLRYNNPFKHKQAYNYPEVRLLAAQIEHEIRDSQTNNKPDNRQTSGKQQLPTSAYRAGLKAKLPDRLNLFFTLNVSVTITNLSTISWLPAEQSGILVAARWLNRKSSPRILIAGYTPLDKILHPGETTEIELSINTPWKYRQRILEIDLIDDGVCWFSDHGSPSLRRSITFSLFPIIYSQKTEIIFNEVS